MEGLHEDARRSLIMERFEIPDIAEDMLDFFFTSEEQDFIAGFDGSVIECNSDNEEFLRKEYSRGIVSKTDESGRTYRLNNFYSMLDVFVISNKEKYDTLGPERKKTLDDWYFEAYFGGLDSRPHPTSDRIVPMDEMLRLIDGDERRIYLNYCDCRSLTGECGFPVRTCLTYRSGINSFADRGLSEEIDKERAKQIIIDADKAGLMHTINDGGICNCCGDCCYLFRSQTRRQSTGVWPMTQTIAAFDTDKCIGCGRCIKRCHFDVFTRTDDGGISCDTASCVGCGLCVNTCPAGAIALRKR